MTNFLVSFDDVAQALPAAVMTKLNSLFATIASVAAKAPLASPAFTGTPTGITKAHVGLSVVDNTADSAKPVSTAQAAADTAARARANHTGTQLSSTISDFSTAAAAAGAGGGNSAGTYATRPAANTVPSGFLYFVTNVPETYRSNGTIWTVVGSGGSELGYAEWVNAFQSVPNSASIDVTGLTTTFVVGERPISIEIEAQLSNSLANGETTAYIILDGAVKATMICTPGIASSWNQYGRRVRITGLTPGTTHTAKVQFASTVGAGAGYIAGSATNPISIQVVTV